MKFLFLTKYLLSGILIFAGIMHFLKPQFFMKIMPAYLPFHAKLVFVSGLVEIVCGILLLFPQTQTYGAYLTIALLIAVFPANIQMARDYYTFENKYFWITVLRLPLQFFLIWWAFLFIK